MTQKEKVARMESVLISIVRQSHVGKVGKLITRSKSCHYPASLYHEAREIVLAIAAAAPVDEDEA